MKDRSKRMTEKLKVGRDKVKSGGFDFLFPSSVTDLQRIQRMATIEMDWINGKTLKKAGELFGITAGRAQQLKNNAEGLSPLASMRAMPRDYVLVLLNWLKSIK